MLKGLTLIFLLWPCVIMSQQTVGLFVNKTEAYEGYTLFSNNTTTYLIDNCGLVINRWESQYRPGSSVYLLENGNLLRPAQIEGAFNAGGYGGRFELFSWNGELLWSFEYNNELVQAHHDIAPLPNGNFLIIAWEKHGEKEAQEMGRKYAGEVWSEQVLELEMIGKDEANIVWEWHVWDHLIQSEDENKKNFGRIADYPERIDLNFIGEGHKSSGNWLHFNAIDYNPDLDQIALSSRLWSEVWIIDHSTTSQEAAASSGGTYGKGGDLLYRYGNPRTYQRGTKNDQIFFHQHDVRWIPKDYPHGGKLMVFNNEFDSLQSSIEIWTPPADRPGFYALETGQPFGPQRTDWFFTAPELYSPLMSGAQMLPNGNLFICEGMSGRFLEINPSQGEVLWEYINPVNPNGAPVLQGTNIRFNQTFRATRYGVDFPAFADKTMSPGEPVELNPLLSSCFDPSSKAGEHLGPHITLLGNPVSEKLILRMEGSQTSVKMEVIDMPGRKLLQQNIRPGKQYVNIATCPPGLYLLAFSNHQGVFKTHKICILR